MKLASALFALIWGVVIFLEIKSFLGAEASISIWMLANVAPMPTMGYMVLFLVLVFLIWLVPVAAFRMLLIRVARRGLNHGRTS